MAEEFALDAQLEAWSDYLPDLPDCHFHVETNECFGVATTTELLEERVPSSSSMLSDSGKLKVECDISEIKYCSPTNSTTLLLEENLQYAEYEADTDPEGEVSTPATIPSTVQSQAYVRVKAEPASGTKRDRPDEYPELCGFKLEESEKIKKRRPIVRPQYKCGLCGQLKKGHVCTVAKKEQLVPRVFRLAYVLTPQPVAVGSQPQMAVQQVLVPPSTNDNCHWGARPVVPQCQ
eukprot:CAMPEP_0114558828 /NCGR_PEP_ID=MMETSP0114-20121206/10594_1 /TAXON_ID=31324 /ORGANISM="Goniomonas sp, Strain m" /LENGTH=233 /DNA_ID=CAMNT_0001744253 /DNA_START=23 /DNA_END=724 /DNA_ORIENTATION=+